MVQNKKPVSFDEWAAAGGGVKPAETGLIGRAGDLGISVLKGAIAVPEAAVGLADIATGGKAGKAAEGLGFRPKEAKEFLDSKKSDAAKDAAWRFENAEGFTGKLGAAVQNPSLIANAIAESAPLMGAGGVIGRGVAALTPRVAGAAGAIGEGAVGAGSAAEQIRQQTADGELTGAQAGLAGLAGVATAGLGMLGKKAANAMGVGDIDTALVSGTTKVAGQAGKETPGMLKRVGGGALAEGVFEELPQSVAEQGLQNIALDKPFTQDLDAAAAMGLVTGGAMGAGMGIMSSPADAKGPGPGAAPAAPPVAPPALTVAGPNFGAPGKTVLDERSLYAAGVTPPPVLDAARLDGMLGEPQKPVDTFASILDTDGVYERWSNVRDGTDRQAMRDQMEYVSQTYGGKVGPDNRYEVDAELARQFKWYRAAPMEMRSAALNRLAEQPARGPSDADLISQEQAGGVRRTYDPRSGVAPDVPLGLVPEVDGVPFDEPAKPFGQNFVIPERPSVAMGLDPSLGGLTSAAALAVDTGASPAVSQGFGMRRMGDPVDVQPVSSAAGLIGTPRRIGESPIIDVEAREVLDQRAIQTAGRLPFDQGGMETTATGQPLSLPAPTNLREGMSRIRAQREQAARMTQQVQQPTQGALNGPQADQTQQTETQRPQAQPSAGVAADAPASAGPMEAAIGGGIEQSRLPNDGAIANNVVEEKTIATNSIAQKAKVRKSQKIDAAEQVWQTKTLNEREKLVGDAGVNGIFALRMAEKQWGKVPEKVRKKLAVALAPEEDAIAAPSTPGTWEKFGEDTGTLNVPRAEMPQIKTAHRGAMTNFLNARGVGHEAVEVDPATLKPTQAEFSPEKVERAKEAGGDRSILISSDDHIIDGHHQAVAKLATGEPVKAIRLDAPAAELLPLVKEFPSATVDASSGPVEAEKPATAPDDEAQAKKPVQTTEAGKPAETEPKPATPPATPKLTQVEAADLMEWVALGTKDGVTKHILTFYESKADKDANRGRMTVATVSKGDRSPDHWMVDGDDTRFGIRLAAAKKRGMEIGMAKAKSDGFVEMSAIEQALGADYATKPVDKAAKLRKEADALAKEASKMLEGIAPGQPVISVRDRNLRERSGEKMRKAGELLKEADSLDAAKSGAVAAKPEPKKAEEAKTASKTPTVDAHAALMDAVHTGKATPEQFKAGFEAVVAGAEVIKAELGTRTKADLLKMGGPYMQMRYSSENKPEIIDAMYREMLGEFLLGESLTYGMGKNSYRDAIAKRVEAVDADKLAKYVAERKAAIEEAAERRVAAARAVVDPKTLDDFKAAIRAAMMDGKTRKEAYLSLTPEQRIRFDELDAESTREAREARKRAQKTQVQAAGQTTGGQIIATKHTRDGYDLFVVQLSDRLSKEDYSTVLASAKRMGGWYSAFRGNGATPGFQFKEKASAEAFLKLAGGDTTAAQDQAAQRRDAFEDDRSQTAAERLTEMADRLEERADEELGRDRKANTARRARFAASAEAAASNVKALAKTMRNIAAAIGEGKAKFLDAVRTKTQVEMLAGVVATAKYNELAARFPEYADREKRKGEPPTIETADFAEFPTFTAFRSDLATLARQMLEVDGTKKLGQQLMSVADDVTDAYLDFAKGNLLAASQFGRGGAMADFSSKATAEAAIRRSGLVGKAIVLQIKRGENRVILSPSEAMSRGVWKGDGDKRITLTKDAGMELVQAIGRKGNQSNGLKVPWQFETAADRLKALSRMGIETPAEFRSAVREFISLRVQAQEADRVKAMERAMVGRKADGLDFFPTPAEVADQMVEAAEVQAGMRVLEPSAGMGHLADRIRAAGAEPDVVELSGDRRELLEEKGYNVVANDFMAFTAPTERGFTFGDLMRATDGTQGILRGQGGMGSDRVRLVSDDAEQRELGKFNLSELEGIERRGVDSGYDRIIMNPPFGDRRDAEHVRHAYSLLKPGGRLVAIMGEGVFFGKDKKAEEFREWLDTLGGTSEKLPEGSFMDPSLPVTTGVNARMVVVDKPNAGVAMFSRSKPSDEEQRALDALSANDELFALPRPTADNIEGIAAEIDPEIKVEKAKAEPGIKEKYKLTMPGGEVGYLYVRAPNPYGPTVYAFDLANGQMTNKVEERPGDNPEDVDPDIEDVYIDVSKLTEGGGGNEVYAIAGAFAHGTGRVFIGDPAGLSDEAMRRRPEAMLSLALKYGTTDFMAPHPRQMRGDAQLKIPGLKWVYGDSVGNIKRLVELNVKALDNAFPDAAKVLFDERTGSFVNADSGKVIGLQFLGARMDRLRSGGASEARKALAGRKTVARGAVWRSLLRQPRETTGGVDGGRNGLLAGLARIAAQSNPATKGLFSRDQSKPTGIAPTLAQQIVDGITARWANAPDVVVLADMQDEKAPEAVRKADAEQRSQGAEGEPEGFWYKGKAYIVASALNKPADVARVLFHEALGHYGLRGVFGDGLKPILQQIATMRRGDVRTKAEQYGLDMTKESDRLQAAEEVLAEMAQTKPEIGFVKRAIAVIRAWLRKHVPGFGKMALTDEEIVSQYLLPARNFVLNGGPNGGPGGGVQFSLSPMKSIDANVRRGLNSLAKALDEKTTVHRAMFRNGLGWVDFVWGDVGTIKPSGRTKGAMGISHILEARQRKDGMTEAEAVQLLNDVVNTIASGAEVSRTELGSATRVRVERGDTLVWLTKQKGSNAWVVTAYEKNPDGAGAGRATSAPTSPAASRTRDQRVAGFGQIIGQNEPDVNQGDDTMFSRATGNTSPTGAQDAFSVKGAAADQLAHYRGMGMQVLGRRQIVDLYGDMLPELKEYDRLVQRMDADKNESGAEADALVSDWAKLDERGTLGVGIAKHPGMERKLAELMHDATLAQIDPDKPLQKGDDAAAHKALADRFSALTPKAQEVYRTARDMYANHFKKVQAAIQDRIQRSGMDETSKAKMIAKMDADLFNKLKGVYFPLARFGKYVVVSKNEAGETVSVSRAETLAEANKLRREVVKNSAPGVTVSRVYKDAEFNATRDAVGKGFVSDLMTMLQGQGVGEDVLDSVGQLYLSSLPDLSWAKHGIHRKGTPGFSQDARRAFAQNMFHGARHLAKLRYSDQLADKLMDMEERVKDRRDDEGFDPIKAQQVVDEMNARHENLMNPKTSSLSTALTSVGFVWFLGISPASALVNLSQTALVAYPVMAAKWGFQKAGTALLSASAEVVRAGNDLSKVLKGDELSAFQKAVDDGTIDVTQAHDLAGVAQGEDERVAMAMRPVMRAASFMFHHAEKFNRQATFIAAYRLAKEAGADTEKAFEQAKKATYDGHFDYSASNRPRLMQGNWQKVLFLFKQYGQNMVYTLTRQAYLAMKGMTPEQRTEARKQLGGLLAMHAMAAGALGLPLVGVLLSAASMLGSDDDEPWDAEVALKNMMADAMGPKAAEVMAHGLSRLTPWDLSGRVALNKLILPDIQEGLEGQPLWEKMVTAAAGPVAGIGQGFFKGMAEMGQGEYMRGLESMLPVALKNPVKAIRFGEEGVVDRTGVVIKDDVGLAGLIGQASGFRPSDVALATEGKMAIFQADKALTERRSNIVRMYAQARMSEDADGVQDVLDQVRRFNERNPTRRITMPNLMQSVRNRQRRIDEAEQGVYLPKTRRDALEAGRFAMAE